jgi:ABC-type glycerol-3-phosphate transport system permease component
MQDQTNYAERLRRVEQVKYAMIIVSVIPILIAYPFIQRYFVKGVLIGAIKG